MEKLVVHVAETEVSEETGMGRIAWHWRDAFRDAGYEFIHIGPARVGGAFHPSRFPALAFQAFKKLGKECSLCLVHEPAAGPFVKEFPGAVLFSHGIERRCWETFLEHPAYRKNIRFRSRLLFPLWRLRGCDAGLKRAAGALLSNTDDRAYALERYGREPGDTFVFRNGVYPSAGKHSADGREILFTSSWIYRKGTQTLSEAARLLNAEGVECRWTLAATGLDEATVLGDWPEPLRAHTKVIPSYRREEENALFQSAGLYVMPSFFEGQPLALLQAMEAGLCCITTNCCGQKDVIKHGENGLLFRPGDAVELARLIKLCLGDAALRERLGARARESMSGRSWEKTALEVKEWVERKAAGGNAKK